MLSHRPSNYSLHQTWLSPWSRVSIAKSPKHEMMWAKLVLQCERLKAVVSPEDLPSRPALTSEVMSYDIPLRFRRHFALGISELQKAVGREVSRTYLSFLSLAPRLNRERSDN
jgi:hypothetical protein